MEMLNIPMSSDKKIAEIEKKLATATTTPPRPIKKEKENKQVNMIAIKIGLLTEGPYLRFHEEPRPNVM